MLAVALKAVHIFAAMLFLGGGLGSVYYKIRAYQGGDLVRTFGDPARGRSSVQVEINRSLYMDEATCEPHAGFAPLQADLSALARELAAWAREAAREAARDG